MKEIKKALLAAAAVTAVLALTACSGCGGDAETSQTTTTAAKTTQETSQAAKETKKITETTTKSPKVTETRTQETDAAPETTKQQAWDPVTEEQGGGYEPITTVHQHSWVWVEPVTHVETIYESVYHPPVTHEWTHKIQDGYQFRCLRCWEVFLDDRECVEHCIICGGSMRTEPHYTDITETVVDQEEYWSEEAVGTKVVTDSEGYWKCPSCGSVK